MTWKSGFVEQQVLPYLTVGAYDLANEVRPHLAMSTRRNQSFEIKLIRIEHQSDHRLPVVRFSHPGRQAADIRQHNQASLFRGVSHLTLT